MWSICRKGEVLSSSAKNKILNQLKTEVKQENEFKKCVISAVLYSKRLLVDHVEALESCMSALGDSDLAQVPRNIFTVRNTCLLVAGSCLQAYFTPTNYKMTTIPLILASGTFTGVTIAKSVVSLRHKMALNHLQSFIKSLDEFGNCIKRNTTYFNEILMMKSIELIETRQIERAWDCITSSKEVIEILYDATRKMEESYLLNEKYVHLYSSMEDLRDTEYFKKNVTDYTPKDIKDFYNIFAYVQSQFLLRLALTTIQYPSNDFVRSEIFQIREQIQEHVNEEEEHFRKLTLELKRKQIIEISELQNKQPIQRKTGPVAILQESSLRLNSCMLAVADECHLLDETLQKLSEDIPRKPADEGKHLMEVANSMRLIEASLAVCCDDFHRLCLVYNRFLSLKLGTKNNNLLITQTDVSSLDSSLDPEESILRVEITNNNDFDDFYAYAFDENEKPVEVTQKDNRELENELAFLDEKITKSTFRPVLRQLKGKIDPIRKEMLEKERQILKSKGINVDEFLGKEDGNEKNQEEETSDHSDSEGSADEAHELSRKAYQQAKQFDEMREYLAQKPRINLFGLGGEGERSVCGEEQILE